MTFRDSRKNVGWAKADQCDRRWSHRASAKVESSANRQLASGDPPECGFHRDRAGVRWKPHSGGPPLVNRRGDVVRPGEAVRESRVFLLVRSGPPYIPARLTTLERKISKLREQGFFSHFPK